MDILVKPRVAIVILNWKKPDETRSCLRSLRKLKYPNWHVVVVDNACDRSIQTIGREFPEASILLNEENIGFAAGMNRGIARAMDDGADYVLLLNDDAELAPNALSQLVQVAEADSEIGILGPTIFYFDEANVIWSAGGSVGRLGDVRHLNVDEREETAAIGVRDVDYVTGCVLLASRRLIDTVGLLDERFFAYFEETEWCVRARKSGFRVVHVRPARAWHKLHRSDRGQSAPYLYLMSRNRLLFLRLTQAAPGYVFLAIASLLRTALSWSLNPRHRSLRSLAPVLALGVRDFLIGRFGAPPARL